MILLRTSNSIKNVIWASLTFAINIIINFVSRKIFITYLGVEYNGINSLFNSIISMLSIAELGIGTTIIYKLYAPIARNDIDKITSLLNFYKKCYRIIAIVVLCMGILLIPFLPSIIGEINLSINIYCVYLLFLADSIFSYLISYKRSVLIANQQERIIKKIHIICTIFLNAFQILLIYFSKNYYLYLTTKIILTVIENVVISLIVNKKYPYIKNKPMPLEESEKSDLIKRVKAMFFHQIGGFIVNGTDNILISTIFGVTFVGYYNNYFLIISSLISFVSSLFSAITASIGNLLSTSNEKKNLEMYNNINFINFIIASFTSCLFFLIIQKFIAWWINSENLLGIEVVITLVIYYYLRIMKFTILSFKNAAGIFYEDRFVPLIESLVNIVSSIIFAKLFGLSGILMGTILSTLILYIYSYPNFVYEKIFKKNKISFYLDNIKYIIITVIFIVISYFLNKIIIFNNFYLDIIKTIVLVTIVFTFMMIVIYRKTDEFKYMMNIIKKVLKRIKNINVKVFEGKDE